ncbi:ComF family protein [Martelella alba]|uniref:ComF family protein n=1 Tax=Martelella alba TaxID=2590451 RepID=A0A506U955_9HYPH|nr:ComF family protein [Martelella alba]TPW30058.1 ComF family protein [Martelella alba]
MDRLQRLQNPLSAAGRALGSFGTSLGTLVLPAICPGCGRRTGTPHALCPECWSDIRFIERPYCERLGLPFSHDLGTGILSPEAIAHPPPFDKLRAAVAYDGKARALVHALKYRDSPDLAPMMARFMARAADGIFAEADAILSIPLHRRRLVARRFNQSAELARQLAKLSGTPFLAGLIERRRHTDHQVGLTRPAREDNVRGAFAIAKGRDGEIFSKTLILIDDVFTTGATVSAATRVLKKAGARRVFVLTFARVLY